MITESNLINLKSWFASYVKGFYSGNMEFNENIKIKEEHTKRVCIEILDIAHSLNLDRNDFYLAEAAALLHDIGRFEQYVRYGTYMDSQSEDHALLGVRILSRNRTLIDIAQPTSELILRLIKHHNRVKLPESEDDEFLFFLKILRDADKVDIWYIVTDCYSNNGKEHNNCIGLGLPETPEVSGQIISNIMDGNIARLEDIKTLNDFKLLQLSWIYDVNFPRTFQIIKKRNYLEKIYNTLPKSDTIAEAYLAVKAHLDRNYRNIECFDTIP